MTTGAPLISVVIPTFNRSRLCSRAIRSTKVLRDLRIDAEVIVVDDGSSDDSQSLLPPALEETELPHKFVVHAENRGLAHARASGAAAAQGEWILLLDSDNELVREFPASLSARLRCAPESVAVFWRGMRRPDGSATVGSYRGVPNTKAELFDRFEGEYLPLVRRRVALKYSWPTFCHRHACEPYFWARLALDFDFDIAPDVIGRYETTGEDRFCAKELTEARAADLGKCFGRFVRDLGPEVMRVAPAMVWGNLLRAIAYSIAGGEMVGGDRMRRYQRHPLVGPLVGPLNRGVERGTRVVLTAINAHRAKGNE